MPSTSGPAEEHSFTSLQSLLSTYSEHIDEAQAQEGEEPDLLTEARAAAERLLSPNTQRLCARLLQGLLSGEIQFREAPPSLSDRTITPVSRGVAPRPESGSARGWTDAQLLQIRTLTGHLGLDTEGMTEEEIREHLEVYLEDFEDRIISEVVRHNIKPAEVAPDNPTFRAWTNQQIFDAVKKNDKKDRKGEPLYGQLEPARLRTGIEADDTTNAICAELNLARQRFADKLDEHADDIRDAVLREEVLDDKILDEILDTLIEVDGLQKSKAGELGITVDESIWSPDGILMGVDLYIISGSGTGTLNR